MAQTSVTLPGHTASMSYVLAPLSTAVLSPKAPNFLGGSEESSFVSKRNQSGASVCVLGSTGDLLLTTDDGG